MQTSKQGTVNSPNANIDYDEQKEVSAWCSLNMKGGACLP